MSATLKLGKGPFHRAPDICRRQSRVTHHTSRSKEHASHIIAQLLACLLLPCLASASPSSALREYNSGQYDQSLKEYEQLLQRRSDDPRLHFNAGAAAYRGRRFEEAAKQFNEALASPDVKLQERAYYNLGNTLYQLGMRNPDPSKKIETWESSLKGFDSTLKLNPQDADAKFNYEFVKKKLEELKQQQQQQNKDDKKDQDQQQKDQQQQGQKENQDEKKDQQQKQDQQSQQQKQDEKDKQQQQASNQSKEQEEKERQQKEQQEKQQKQQQANQSKEKPDQKDQGRPAQSYAAAQMTPEQAQQLLDAQKGDEAVLPVRPTEKPKQANRSLKDW